MKKFTKLLVLIMILTIQRLSAFNIIIEDINEKYGLPKNRVNCMLQDSIGYLWFGMANGLYKFDLNTFTKYDLEKNNFIGFPESDIRAIIEYEPGMLLVGTYNKGLLLFNSLTERHDSPALNSPIDFSNLCVNCLYKEENGILWIGTNNGLLQVKKEDKKNKFILLKRFDVRNSSLLSSDIIEIKESKDGKVWFLTMTDIGFFNPSKNILETFPALKANSSFTFLDSVHILKSCFETGLDIFNTETFLLRDFEIKGQADYTQTRFVFKDSESNIWLSISNVGLMYMESINQISEAILISNKNNRYTSLNSNVIYKIYESRDGAIWLCTEEGISMVRIRPDIFNAEIIRSKYNPELTLGIRSLLDSEEDFIWTGTLGEGLKKFNIDNGTFTDVELKNQGEKIGKNIQAIIRDFQGNLWLGTEGEGVIKFIPDKKPDYIRGNTINYRIYPRSYPVNSIPNDYIMCLMQDKNKNIWVGTWYGLSIIDSFELSKTNQSDAIFKNFQNNPADEYSVSNNIIMSLLEDKEGNIWVGTQAGLNKIIRTIKGYQFEHDYKNEKGKSLTERKILVIFQDGNGNIWFSTQDGGICLLDTISGIFHEFNSTNGFHDDIVNSITEDSLGMLWLGTNNGLCRFDPSNSSFNIYRTEDGLISNDFFFGSSCKKENKLYFGGDKGITYFNPKRIIQTSFKPNLVFTDFRLFNKPVIIDEKDSPLKKHIGKLKQITLKYNQNYVTIAFAALNYKQYNGLQYTCILEGLETNWNRLDKERKITYTNLSPGHYLFRARVFSPGHIDNSSEISLQIIVNPPLWKTTWAYFVYFMLLFFIVVRIYIYFLNEEKKKHALAIERMNAKRIHEMDLLKLHFYTNVSHELRTPLTLISAPLESLLKDNVEHSKMKSYYEIMLKNIQRLKRLIDQLLDLRKIEEGYLTMEWKKGNIIDFIERIYTNFENYAEKRNMYFTFQTSCSQLDSFFDPDKLDKILFNLISNAFKYTPDFGTISIKLDVKNALSIPFQGLADTYLEIKLSDSGIGIPKDSITKIFDPFQQVHKNKPIGSTGTGIGLSLTKELVEKHMGFISVESEVDKGSVFSIFLPIFEAEPDIESDSNKKDLVTSNEMDFDKIAEKVVDDKEDEVKYAARKPLILIVEDNSDLRKFLNNELQSKYRIDEAENGQKGLREAISRIPDLIVSDVMMHKMDGLELCKKLKNDLRTSHIPVILLTARHSEEIIQNSYDIGADDYITKPFSMSLLKTRINNLIEQRRKLRSLFSRGVDFDYSEVPANNLDSQFLEKLNKIIEKNIDDPDFSPPKLASDMAMSKMQLYRKVSALANQTVYNYIRTVRMKKAAKLLLTKDMQIAEVAFSVGYTEPSNFTKCFYRAFNQSPSNFVKANRK
jgi:signal transduction histidine kinase/ligand-binding sensor domain-containing protein/DNA-binding response OmpR family regulator